MRKIVNLAFASLLMLLPLQIFSQDIELRQVMVGSSAGISSELTGTDTYQLYGSVGQPAATTMAGFPQDPDERQNWYVGFWGPWWTVQLGIEEDVEAGKAVTNYPNPVNNFTTIKFNTDFASNITFNVYDMSGRNIYSYNSMVQSGENLIDWNARSADGNLAPSGTYLYEVLVEPLGGSINSSAYALKNIMVINR